MQAAVRAGYSKKTAQIIGFENLSKPIISAAIETAMRARSDRTEITQDRVLAEVWCFSCFGCFASGPIERQTPDVQQLSGFILRGCANWRMLIRAKRHIRQLGRHSRALRLVQVAAVQKTCTLGYMVATRPLTQSRKSKARYRCDSRL
jgi:hypothetical protein